MLICQSINNCLELFHYLLRHGKRGGAVVTTVTIAIAAVIVILLLPCFDYPIHYSCFILHFLLLLHWSLLMLPGSLMGYTRVAFILERETGEFVKIIRIAFTLITKITNLDLYHLYIL